MRCCWIPVVIELSTPNREEKPCWDAHEELKERQANLGKRIGKELEVGSGSSGWELIWVGFAVEFLHMNCYDIIFLSDHVRVVRCEPNTWNSLMLGRFFLGFEAPFKQRLKKTVNLSFISYPAFKFHQFSPSVVKTPWVLQGFFYGAGNGTRTLMERGGLGFFLPFQVLRSSNFLRAFSRLTSSSWYLQASPFWEQTSQMTWLSLPRHQIGKHRHCFWPPRELLWQDWSWKLLGTNPFLLMFGAFDFGKLKHFENFQHLLDQGGGTGSYCDPTSLPRPRWRITRWTTAMRRTW